MRGPDPIETGALLVALWLATTPAAMGVRSLTDAAYLTGAVYLAAAVLVASLPPLLVRQLPGPRRLVRSALGTAGAAVRRQLRSFFE